MLCAAGFSEGAPSIDYNQFLQWTYQGSRSGGSAPGEGQRRRKRGRAERQRGRRARDQVSGSRKKPDMGRNAQLIRVIREGGCKGADIEGAADLGGLQFFSSYVLEPDGDVELLLESLGAMNAEGQRGKMVFSAGQEQLAIAAFVPEASQQQLCCAEWLQAVLQLHDGETLSVASDICTGRIRADPDTGITPLKIREALIVEANNFLRARKLFPDAAGDDDSDDFLYGDDDFPG